MQLVDNGPLQVLHDGEQGAHSWPVLNDSGGHVELWVTLFAGSQFFLSVKSWMNPVWQEMQSPVSSAHLEHPR